MTLRLLLGQGVHILATDAEFLGERGGRFVLALYGDPEFVITRAIWARKGRERKQKVVEGRRIGDGIRLLGRCQSNACVVPNLALDLDSPASLHVSQDDDAREVRNHLERDFSWKLDDEFIATVKAY